MLHRFLSVRPKRYMLPNETHDCILSVAAPLGQARCNTAAKVKALDEG